MIPTVHRLESSAARPLWSVMIPTCNPDLDLLELTVRSVLQQDRGPSRMEIQIVDDCSEYFRPADYVDRFGGRLQWFRQPERVGIAGNWNSCIDRSAGHWIHILHQDDLVLDGFYEYLERGFVAEPEIGAAVCEHHMIDEAGRRMFKVARVEVDKAGVLDDWHTHFFERLSFMTPAVVVARRAYEQLGGFDDDFQYALDWDMWKRVAARYPVWYEPRPLAEYRRHEATATANHRSTGRNIAEIRESIDRSVGYLEPEVGLALAARARRNYTSFALRVALRMVRRGDVKGALRNVVEARRMSGWGDLGRSAGAVLRSYATRRTNRPEWPAGPRAQ